MTRNDMPTAPLPTDFADWWTAPGDWVEEPNQRRSGWSGMMRLHHAGRTYYVKKQCNHLCRTLSHPFGWPTVSREFANIRRLQALGITVPTPVFHGSRRTADGLEGLLITEELVDFAALDTQADRSPAEKSRLATAVGRMLGRMHAHNLQHSCLYDKHIMVRWQDGQPTIALIDLEKLRRAWLPGHAARHDLDQLKRHQQIWPDADWALLEQAHRAAGKPGAA
ncbi:MAG TPA: lipopolysaccharide kinase InaA family protein [Azonexus sp.]